MGLQSLPDASLPVSCQLHWGDGSLVPHAQRGSIEQQDRHGSVVAVPHSLVQSCVTFLWRGDIMLRPSPAPGRAIPTGAATNKRPPCPVHPSGPHTR